MNTVSSRSHLILTLKVNKFHDKNNVVSSAKLNIVDLAGSERLKNSKASGNETGHINKSLFHLQSVIDDLSVGKKRNIIPFRNSSLTRLLCNSLGGNCKTSLLAMVSPS